VAANKQASFRLQTGMADAFTRAERALLAIGTVTRRDWERGQLEGSVPLSFLSWGENVRVQLQGVEGDVTVYVKSESILPTTLFDFGKNAGNIKKFAAALYA
jgi:hypothetical protein